jgi:hypothetical protein
MSEGERDSFSLNAASTGPSGAIGGEFLSSLVLPDEHAMRAGHDGMAVADV